MIQDNIFTTFRSLTKLLQLDLPAIHFFSQAYSSAYFISSSALFRFFLLVRQYFYFAAQKKSFIRLLVSNMIPNLEGFEWFFQLSGHVVIGELNLNQNKVARRADDNL